MKVSIDKKNAFLVIFTLACLSILAAILLKGWFNTWTALHMPALTPPFADMRTVQGSLLSEKIGLDPQVKNPGDPWGRAMNYPMIWFWIAKLFQFNHETNFMIFVCIYILAYLASCFFLLRKSPSVYILLAIFSGTSLLAVERGNNDLLAFVLIFAGITFSQGNFRAVMIFLATVLKIYPAFIVVTLVKKPKIFIPMILFVAGYFLLNFNELKIIQAGNTALSDPALLFASYGFVTNLQIIQRIVLIGQSPVIYALIKYTFILVSLLLVVLLSRNKIFDLPGHSDYKTHLFVAGAIIFSSTYLITSNWDYRLIFLLLCMPYILCNQNTIVRHAMLISIIISSNAILIHEFLGQTAVFLCALSKYFTFIMVSTYLLKEITNTEAVFSIKSLKEIYVTTFDRPYGKTPWYLKPRSLLLIIVLMWGLFLFSDLTHKYYVQNFAPPYGTLNLHITGLRPPGNIIIKIKSDDTQNFSRSAYRAFDSTEMTYAADVIYYGNYFIQVIQDENNNQTADLDSQTNLFSEGFGMANIDKLDLRDAAALKAGSTSDNLKYTFDENGKTVEIKMVYPPFPWQNK